MSIQKCLVIKMVVCCAECGRSVGLARDLGHEWFCGECSPSKGLPDIKGQMEAFKEALRASKALEAQRVKEARRLSKLNEVEAGVFHVGNDGKVYSTKAQVMEADSIFKNNE